MLSLNNSTDYIAKEVLNRLFGTQNDKTSTTNCNQNSQNAGKDKKNILQNLTPSQVLVIAAILGGVLEVDSILVDREQTVQILLEGSLKQKENADQELEDMLNSIGSKSFDDVVRALINRLS